ncbi:MAG: hypothetical protein QOH04_1535 [Sphingomonadales bacterium]|jgi:hypothetical protein|nr:hypothetical protein [Sphingomonadales bacterium]
MKKRGLREKLERRLVGDWRQAHKWWSTRLLALSALVQIIPADAFLSVYAMVPEDLQMLLPSRTLIVVSLTGLAFLGRVAKQKGKADG